MKSIFIGGTGRSGTSIFLHVLYKHPDLYAIPIETKFIVEINGLFELFNFMTDAFSVTTAHEAKYKFGYMMTDVITGRGVNPYLGSYGKQEYYIQDIFENYDVAVNDFIRNIHPNLYYQNRNQLILELRNFIDKLFTQKAVSMGKIGWVEKTPLNIARIEFLKELYPDHEFINMVRDPRGVLYSLMNKGWCNPDLNIASIQLKQQIQHIIEKRKIADENNYKIIDIKLEELVSETSKFLDKVTNFLAIPDFSEESRNYLVAKLKESSMEYDKDKGRVVDSWESEFDKKQMSLIQNNLAEEITLLGYPLL